MDFQTKYDFDLLLNEAERMVFEELERRLIELDDNSICLCQDCVVDMAAFALNMLKPVYRVSLLGKMYAHAMDESGYYGEVKRAVDTAIHKIHDNPSHD
jgi:competence protein ComFB